MDQGLFCMDVVTLSMIMKASYAKIIDGLDYR